MVGARVSDLSCVHNLYKCSHLIWGATSTPRTRRYLTVPDATVPDGTRRYPTRYPTVLNARTAASTP
eukprot:5403753-Prymnesium_polylepis.1